MTLMHINLEFYSKNFTFVLTHLMEITNEVIYWFVL